VIVVADTSVLLNLVFLNQENILVNLFGTIIVPEAVSVEFRRLSASAGRFSNLAIPAFCQLRHISYIPAVLAADARLDAGEAEWLALALDLHADGVLMDESAGRSAAANLGITAIGTLGILVRAKQAGLIGHIAPLLRRLIVDGRFRIAPALVREALQKTGELS
jgi:predicted nucleic acid-binding protein